MPFFRKNGLIFLHNVLPELVMTIGILFIPCITFTQNNAQTISGVIRDSITLNPLPIVHVYLKNAGTGVVTDLKGNYSLTIPVLPDRLIVSCTGYITIEKDILAGSPSDIDFSLLPKVEMLSEVTIQSLKIEPVFRDEDWSVLDYELKEDRIYLLIFRNRHSHSELLLINSSGDTLARQRDLPDNVTRLYKDCIDSIHLLSEEMAYQICVDQGQFAFRFPVSLDTFNLIFGNCVTSLQEYIYVVRHYYYGFGIEYTGIHSQTKARKKLAYIEDPFKINLLALNPQDLAAVAGARFRDEMVKESFEGGIPVQEDYSALRNLQAYHRFTRLAFYAPVKAPLVRIDETIALFDFPNSRICFFDPQGTLFYKVPVTFHRINTERNIFKGIFDTKEWTDYDVLADEERFKAYAIFPDGGKTNLKEIDLFSGNLAGTTTLAYPYPEKLRVSNGYVYFLYKPPGDWVKRRLYRQRMEH